MTATLWVDTDSDDCIELGPTLSFYKGFSQIAKLAGPEFLSSDSQWYALSGLCTIVESQYDIDPVSLANLEKQSKEFLDEYRNELPEEGTYVLEKILEYFDKRNKKDEEYSTSDFISPLDSSDSLDTSLVDNTSSVDDSLVNNVGHGKGSGIPGPIEGEHHLNSVKDILKGIGKYNNEDEAWHAMGTATKDMSHEDAHNVAKSLGIHTTEDEAKLSLRDHAVQHWNKVSGSVIPMPLPVATERPYKIDPSIRESLLQKAKASDVSFIDPKNLTATQPHVYGDTLSTFSGKLHADKPALVVEHQGRYYIEEGHHRVVYAIQSGQHVPIVVAKVGRGGKLDLVKKGSNNLPPVVNIFKNIVDNVGHGRGSGIPGPIKGFKSHSEAIDAISSFDRTGDNAEHLLTRLYRTPKSIQEKIPDLESSLNRIGKAAYSKSTSSASTPKPTSTVSSGKEFNPETHLPLLLETIKRHDKGYNLAPLHKVRKDLSYLNKDQQDKVISHGMKVGKVSGASLEGREGITKEERDAEHHTMHGDRIGYLSLK